MKVQGDLFFIKVEKIPEDARRIKPEGNRYVLARGEATGHAHAVLAQDVELFEKDGTFYLRVLRPVQVIHEEHLPINLDYGVWRVGIQREYDPLSKSSEQIRPIID